MNQNQQTERSWECNGCDDTFTTSQLPAATRAYVNQPDHDSPLCPTCHLGDLYEVPA